ncbi:hypothetical protein GAYE_SCF02G2098 [Galdieria yellowstonensis]|uniref:Transmembrane protein 53 n=1 Tax=Galdieria yellowstonensis TaxID=3028027 RepID=A0AAV9I9W2_9RHOD|nr:hypothetical protein GAYE_SCF02G2098 [Galdieria yellowstonensis]
MNGFAFCWLSSAFPQRKQVVSKRANVVLCRHSIPKNRNIITICASKGPPRQTSFRSFLNSLARKKPSSPSRKHRAFRNGASDGSSGNGSGGGRFKYLFDEREPPNRTFLGIMFLLRSFFGVLRGGPSFDGFYGFLIVYSLTAQRTRSHLGSCLAETAAKTDVASPEKNQKCSAFISETARPAVVLLSFLGAKQRQLKKYADFYFSKGYDVYVVFNNLPTAIFPSVTQRQARKVLDILEKIPDGQPVFVHAISIGTGIWGLVLEEFRKNSKRLEHLKGKISGVIYDSGPSNVSPSLLANGLYSACPKLSKKVWNVITNVTFWLTRAGTKFRVGELALQDHQVEQAPQLYLYSRDDHVISSLHESIQKFVEKNKQRGVEVYQQVWEKSLHATHLKVHPEEYMKSVEDFLNRCLQLRNKMNQHLIPGCVKSH